MTGLHPDNPVGHPVFIQASDSFQRPLGTGILPYDADN